MARNDEPTINVALAEVLRSGNPRWRGEHGSIDAEQLNALEGGGKPDIVVSNHGAAPVVVELECAPARTVESEAQSRVGRKLVAAAELIEQVVAVRAPDSLREVDQRDLNSEINQCEFEFCLYSVDVDGKSISRMPESGWLTGDVRDLATLLENASLSERLVARSLDTLQQAVFDAATVLKAHAGKETSVKLGTELHQAPGEQTDRMAMAILANALIFHTAIAPDFDISEPRKLRDESGQLPVDRLSVEWYRILNEINYWPIFVIAQQVLAVIPDRCANKLLDILDTAATHLAASGVTRSQDITGRMFQRLISDRKFLATFYTRPESARFLAELAINRLNVDWGNSTAVTELRIGDLACGTGTLISAAYHSTVARFRRHNGDDEQIHRPMVEQALIAADIMPVATHLTTAMISSVHPHVTFRETQVYTLPYGRTDSSGVHPLQLGALDLIEQQGGIDLLGTGIKRLRGKSAEDDSAGGEFSLRHDSLDLIIMNPPFVRPGGHEGGTLGVPVPAFAGLGNSEEDQLQMSNRLKQIRSRLEEPAGHGNAGLASNFIDLAHAKLKPGGILALVLPVTVAQGKSWAPSRHLLAKHYHEVTIISIAANKAGEQSFSADTNMGEALVIAKKRKIPTRNFQEAKVCWVSLPHRPSSLSDAVETARALDRARQQDTPQGTLLLGDDYCGSFLVTSIAHGACASISDLSVAHAMIELERGMLQLPRLGKPLTIPVTRLGTLGKQGLHPRDITGVDERGPFDLEELRGIPTYPVLWNHNLEGERCLLVTPHQQLQVRPGLQNKADTVWKLACRLHLNRDFSVNAHSLAACMTAEPSLGGRGWPNFFLTDPAHEPIIALWMNSTLGIINFWWTGTKQHPGRAMVPVGSQPQLNVIDAGTLSAEQLRRASDIFEHFSERELMPAFACDVDEVRHELDAAILIELLGLPESMLEPLAILRRKWCTEPSVHAGKTKPPTNL